MLKNYEFLKIHVQNSKINLKSVFLSHNRCKGHKIWREKKLMLPKSNTMLLL
jgi:hypothetical protein